MLKNNSDGPFATPATGSLDAEWGSAPFHVPHRFNVTFNNQIVRNLLGQINFNTASGNPYTIRTGFDENGDLIYNDRPDGVGRNTVRGEQQWNLNMAAAYTILFGRQTTLPPGIAVVGGGGGPQVQTVNQSGQRFRLQFVVQVQNVTNNANYVGLQRRAHVAVLRPAHVRAQHTESGHGSATEFLGQVGRVGQVGQVGGLVGQVGPPVSPVPPVLPVPTPFQRQAPGAL